MNLERLTSFALFLAVIAAGFFAVQQQNQRNAIVADKYAKTEYVTFDEVFHEELTLWWPGLSGVYPSYIGKKGLKGLGWEEFPAYKLKDRLKNDYGVKIIDWMINPSRLAAEFKLNRRPICIYPYKWKDPEKELTGPRTQLLSYAFDYGGERDLGILIRKNDIKRFIPYLKEDGNLNLGHLLKDKNLSTAIIKGQDYDDEVLNSIDIGENGAWDIKKEFRKNINLMVASDNSQLLKMLYNKRIDYVLDQLIIPGHYRLVNISRNQFKTLVYRKDLVESFKDPRILRYSIRCNLHPLNYKVMPVINELVQALGGQGPKVQWNRHRQKFDPDFIPPGQSDLIQQRFTGYNEIWWYQDYGLDKLLGEPLTKKKQVSLENDPINDEKTFKPIKVSREVQFKVFHKNEMLAIFDPGLLESSRKDWIEPYPIRFSRHASGPNFSSDLHNYIPAKMLNLIKQRSEKNLSEAEINDQKFAKIKHLLIVGPSLSLKSVDELLASIKGLESLHLIFNQFGIEKIVDRRLGKQVKDLSLVGMNLMNQNWHHRLSQNKLLSIDLGYSMMMPEDLGKIIKKHSDTLRSLQLKNTDGAFTRNVAKIFRKQSWPNLRSLNLEISSPVGHNSKFDHIVYSLGPPLESLQVRFLFPRQLKYLAENCPNLKTLSAKIIGLESAEDIKIPLSVENLTIDFLSAADGAWDEQKMSALKYPSNLKSLNIEAKFSDLDLENLNQYLSTSLRDLALSGINVKSKTLLSFLKKGNFPDIRFLSLPNSRVSDEHLEVIANRFSKLKGLNLDNNQISDASLTALNLFTQLETLNLSSNFLTNMGYLSLFRIPQISNNMKRLFLQHPLQLDPQDFANILPRNLEEFSLNGANIKSFDALSIMKGLPKSMRILDWSVSFENKDQVEKFIQYLPPKLEQIKKMEAIDGSSSFIDVVNALPNTLHTLDYWPGVSRTYNAKADFPKGLLSLDNFFFYHGDRKNKKLFLAFLEKFKNSLNNLIQSLPNGVQHLRFTGNVLSSIHSQNLAKRPRNTSWIMGSFLGTIPPSNSYLFFGSDWSQIIQALNVNPASFESLGVRHDDKDKIDLTAQYHRDTRLSSLGLSGEGVSDQFAEVLLKYNLSQLNRISFKNSSLTSRGIIKILQALPDHMDVIGLSSSKFALDEVDSIIAALPSSVLKLEIKGLSIGQKGYQKFRDWRERQKQIHGFAPIIDD